MSTYELLGGSNLSFFANQILAENVSDIFRVLLQNKFCN